MTQVTILCSDGPHHLYLAAEVLNTFRQVRVIVEPGDQQVRRHLERKQWRPFLWSKYHQLRRKWFGYDAYRQQYFQRSRGAQTWDAFAQQPGVTLLRTSWINAPEVVSALQHTVADIYIVMGTKKIGAAVLNAIPSDRIINIHGGHLPEYKGNHCFFFALKNGDIDKLSTTIHRVTSGLDAGDILMRCPVRYQEGDNSETLYSRAERSAVDRLIAKLKEDPVLAHWPGTRQEPVGMVYRMRDRGPLVELAHRLGMRKRRLQLADGRR